MKQFRKVIAFALLAAMLAGLMAGCAQKVSGTDAVMSKGEFMLLFVSETGVAANDASDVTIDLPSDSPFYEAARAIVNMGYAKAEDVAKDVEYGVTKEFVATVCVNKLYFRKASEVVLKDEKKLSDPQACKDAVGHGIVNAENGYFDAKEEMTYEACVAAIERMMQIDSEGRFSADDLKVDVQLKEGVINLDDYFEPDEITAIDPSDPAYKEIVDSLTQSAAPVSSQGGSYGVTTLSGGVTLVDAPQGPACPYQTAGEGDLIIIRVPTEARLYENLKPGAFFIFGALRGDGYNSAQLGDHIAMTGEIVEESEFSDEDYRYFLVRIASNEEILAHAQLDGYSSSSNSDSEWSLEEDSAGIAAAQKEYGIDIGNLHIDRTGIYFDLAQTLKNQIESWREPEFEVDIAYNFSITNIDVTCSGWGSIFTGTIDDAIFKVDYTVTNKFHAETHLRATPDNNRNGKFLNNISRSRFTGANAAGAKSIKIARLYLQMPAGFETELYLNLTVRVDGTIDINLTSNCSRGIEVNNNKLSFIRDKKTDFHFDVNVNLEIAVNLEARLRWGGRKSTPILDGVLTLGVDVLCVSNIFLYEDGGEDCTTYYENTALSNEELEYIAATQKLQWCFNISAQFFWRVDVLSENCKAGKLIRFFDEDFDGDSGKKPIGKKLQLLHWENGHFVDECTHSEEETENATNIDMDGYLNFDTYSITVPAGGCDIISVKLKFDDVVDMINFLADNGWLLGGLHVRTEDPKIAEAYIVGNVIFVECHQPGSTRLILETGNKRYSQVCAIHVISREAQNANVQ